jgi:hypothetical protein
MPSAPNGPAHFYADSIEPVCRLCATEVFFLSVEAYPEPGSAEFGIVGGAFIHGYIDADTLRAAEERMVALLQDRGWRPHRLEGWEISSPEAADQTMADGNGVSQFDLVCEALEHGHGLAFYSWDLDATDAIDEEPLLSDCRRNA